MTPLVVVAGTGTEIGKTFVAGALVSAWALQGRPIAGIKPIESGGSEDAAELGRVSTFHVTRFTSPYLLMDPVSPHLAARRDGVSIDLGKVVDWVNDIRTQAEGVVLELAGGLFTPLCDDGATNATLLRLLKPSHVVLVAPDRLGVLHDVIATTKAAHAEAITFSSIVLSTPARSDLSTGTNAEELGRVLARPPILVLTLPRTTIARAQLLLEPLLALV